MDDEKGGVRLAKKVDALDSDQDVQSALAYPRGTRE